MIKGKAPTAYGPTVSQNGLSLLALILRNHDLGRPPLSVREMCKQIGWRSVNGAIQQLRRLEKLGLIERDYYRHRAYTPRCSMAIFKSGG